MNKLSLIVLMLTFTALGNIKAQDRLIKTNNDTIHCTIKEIGDEEIKYLTPEISETVVFGINKDNVSKAIFANGKELTFTNAMFDPENYVKDKKDIIKVGFLSPLFNSTKITYERSISPGRSFETTLGIIGAGWDTRDYNESGVFLKAGYKFIKSPDYYIKGQRFAHILKGAYFRPELIFSYYNYDYEPVYGLFGGIDEPERETNVVGAVMLNIGKQWVFEQGFVLDWFVGVGYGFGKDDHDFGLHKAFIGGIDDFPLAITSGLRIGWNF